MTGPSSKDSRSALNVLYLTWGEVIVDNGLFDNQVLSLLKEIVRVDHNCNLALLSGMPVVNRPYLRGRKHFELAVEEIRRQLTDDDIDFYTRWIPVVARWFHSNEYQHRLFRLGNLRFLRELERRLGVDIVHCRGYHATQLALAAREKYSLTYKILFDTRGLFPEEGVIANHFPSSSRAYSHWKNAELTMLKSVDAVSNVSETFTEHILDIHPNPHTYTIHTSTDLARFSPNPESRQAARRELGIAADERVLVFLGSLTIDTGWYQVSDIVAAFRAFSAAFPQSQLLLITRFSRQKLIAALDQSPETAGRYRVVYGDSPDKTAEYLRAGDYGLLPYKEIVTDIERAVSRTVIASKTGEYLGVGLPILVNEVIGAASRMVSTYRVGVTYRRGDESHLVSPLHELDQTLLEVQNRCRTVAETYFSATRNAGRYSTIYRALAGSAPSAVDLG